MTTTYHIELRLNQPDMLLFLEHARMFKSSITAIPDEERPIAAEDMKLAPEPIYKTTRIKKEHARRAKRGSKVTETILETLGRGMAGVRALKQDLAGVGLSANSLSTGLAILQKSGQIKRLDDGFYVLTEATEVAA